MRNLYRSFRGSDFLAVNIQGCLQGYSPNFVRVKTGEGDEGCMVAFLLPQHCRQFAYDSAYGYAE